jgi:hypothetical protein
MKLVVLTMYAATIFGLVCGLYAMFFTDHAILGLSGIVLLLLNFFASRPWRYQGRHEERQE